MSARVRGRPTADGVYHAVAVHQSGGNIKGPYPVESAVPADDGGRADDVGIDTGAGGDSHGAPHRIRGHAGSRVENVVHEIGASAPSPVNGARCGQSCPGWERDRT